MYNYDLNKKCMHITHVPYVDVTEERKNAGVQRLNSCERKQKLATYYICYVKVFCKAARSKIWFGSSVPVEVFNCQFDGTGPARRRWGLLAALAAANNNQ